MERRALPAERHESTSYPMPTLATPGYLVHGILNDPTNPKVLLSFSSVFPQFLKPRNGSVMSQAIALATIGNGLALIVLVLVAAGASSAAMVYSIVLSVGLTRHVLFQSCRALR